MYKNKLINSFLSLVKTEPRFDDWSLDDYWIELSSFIGDKEIQNIEIIDKDEIDARFDVNKYNV